MNRKSNVKSKKPLHDKLVTRRDFLGAGMIAGSAYLLAPRWLDLLVTPSEAMAANCPANASMIPFISIDLAGGAALASNFVPMNRARQPIASYSKMGLGDRNVPLEREFNNVPFAGYANGVRNDNELISKFYKGLRSQGTAAFSNTAFCGLCTRTRDDSGANFLSVNGLLAKAGLTGNYFANLGTQGTSSGGRHLNAVLSPPAPLRVSRIGDLKSAIGYSAAAGTQLNQKQKEGLAKLVQNLNSSQSRRLASLQSGPVIQNLLECAGVKNSSLIETATNVGYDPVNVPNVASIWGITAAMNESSTMRIHAATVYNALIGNAGSATIELGGYDYHDETRTTGDAKDEAAGQLVARVLETARVLGKPVFIYVSTDGSVFSPDSSSRSAGWAGDRGEAGASYMLYFDPMGRPAFRDNQLGQFTDAQVSDESAPVGSRPEVSAAAVFANWLKANQRLDLLMPTTGALLNGIDTNSYLVL